MGVFIELVGLVRNRKYVFSLEQKYVENGKTRRELCWLFPLKFLI